MNTLEVEKQTTHVARTYRVVQAAADGSLPSKIEVLQTGMWDTPYHGMFMITADDLTEMVTNFYAGMAMAGGAPSAGGIGLPIDFGHESSEKAAGWIKDLSIQGESLYATVEWTDAGKEALLSGNYKCFSPEFYPKNRGGWPDPEQYDVYIPNVLVGGGLTNIPLFKGLKPVMASTSSGQDKRNVIYISASEGEKHMPTLAEVLAKDPSALNDEEKALLTENKEALSDEQKTKFGFEVATAAPVVEAPVVTEEKEEETPVATEVTPELAAVAASIKKGESVVIKASALKALEDTAQEYRTEKAESFVETHLQRGAIKADQKSKWVDAVMANPTNKELLEALPSNTVVAASAGSSEKASDVTSATETVKAKAQEAIKASKETGKELSIGDAYSKVLADNKDLAVQYYEENNKVA